MAITLTARYEALLDAVRAALETLRDGNFTNQEARDDLECNLSDVLEEIGEHDTVED